MAVALSLMVFGSLIWFVNHILELTSGILRWEPVIDFDKGAMYILGCGIGLIALLVSLIAKAFLGKDLPEAALSWIGTALWAGVLIALILPHLVHWGVWTTLKGRDYVVCRELSSRWLRHVTFVYADSPERCLEELMTRRCQGNPLACRNWG